MSPTPCSGPERKGFAVPEEMAGLLLEYLREIESHYPDWYSEHTRRRLSAYALYVRNLMGDRDPDKALRLLEEAGLENFDLDAIGWLWPVLLDAPGAEEQLEAIRRHVNNRAVETAGAANFTTSYDDQTYLLLSSDRRTDAILLDALIADNPQQRPDPQAGQRPAGAPHARALGQHPGERLRAAGAGPLLQHLRIPDAGLCGPHLAGRDLRRGARVPRPHHRAPRDAGPDGLPGGCRPWEAAELRT